MGPWGRCWPPRASVPTPINEVSRLGVRGGSLCSCQDPGHGVPPCGAWVCLYMTSLYGRKGSHPPRTCSSGGRWGRDAGPRHRPCPCRLATDTHTRGSALGPLRASAPHAAPATRVCTTVPLPPRRPCPALREDPEGLLLGSRQAPRQAQCRGPAGADALPSPGLGRSRPGPASRPSQPGLSQPFPAPLPELSVSCLRPSLCGPASLTPTPPQPLRAKPVTHRHAPPSPPRKTNTRGGRRVFPSGPRPAPWPRPVSPPPRR